MGVSPYAPPGDLGKDVQQLEDFTRTWEVLGNHILAWALALLVFAAVFFIAPRVRERIVAYLAREDKNRPNIVVQTAETLTRHTRRFFIAAIAVLLAKQFLNLPPQIDRLIAGGVVIASMVQVGIWASNIVGLWIENDLLDKRRPDPARVSAAQIIKAAALTVVWSAILLLTLSNFGVDITALIAGLGVGGIAVAFALQSVLKDLFASLSIILDKPFVVGDLVTFDGHLGHIEQIGLRTTRVRSLSGEQISVSNDALLSTKVRNFKRMKERRIIFSLHAYYGAPVETLAAFPVFIQGFIEGLEGVRFDRAHLADFNELGPRFETAYYVLSPEYKDYMDRHQEVLIAAARWFEENGLTFAQPSRRLFGNVETQAGQAGFETR